MTLPRKLMTRETLTAAAFGYFAGFAKQALENARFGPRDSRAVELKNARTFGAMARREYARLAAGK